jgi:hypothetical protein
MVPRKPKEVTDDRWLSVTHRSPSPVIYFGGTGVWTQGFVLPNRCSTAWVKAPVHFCSSYFGNGVLSYLPGLAFNLDPPNLSLPSRYDYRYEPLAPGQLVINEVSYKAAMNAKGPDWGGGGCVILQKPFNIQVWKPLNSLGTSVILATQETEIRSIELEASRATS